MSFKISLEGTDPVKKAYDNEYSYIFLSFCSYVCLTKNKKLNMANIFLCLLRDENLRELFKMLCDVESDYDVLKCFLDYDPTLHRSKYIRNYLADNITLKLK